jgi:SEC-C motif
MPSMTPSANSPCHCGSGKKYKRCCRSKDQGLRSLHQRLLAGELPFTARISSTGGESSQFTVSHVSVTRGGVRTVLLEEEIAVSTNAVAGDKTANSAAVISIPVDGDSRGSIRTSGNASVSNGGSVVELALRGGAKKMKAVSPTGLYAVVRLGIQRSTSQQYLDVLFGTSGKAEPTDATGTKQRPHISICPDGNGHFLRLAGHSCQIEAQMTYESATRQVVPNIFLIRSMEHQEVLELVFGAGTAGTQVLEEIRFSGVM